MEFCGSVMEFCQFCPQIVLALYFFRHREEIKQWSRKSAFPDVFRKTSGILN